MNTYIARIIQLLILNNGEVEFNFLMDQLNISKRMIDYYLKQFDDWRLFNKFPPIIAHVDKLTLELNDYDQFFKEFVSDFNVKDYFLTANERQSCIVLLIGISPEKIKIEYLVDYFKVSKNTITNDLILIKEALGRFKVEILSRVKTGYYFVGDEQNIRYVLMQCYHYHENVLFHKFKREFLLDVLTNFNVDTNHVIKNIHDILMETEKNDNENFIFLAISDLIDTILLTVCRSRKFKISLDKSLPEVAKSMMEYFVTRLLDINISIEDDEIVYLYLILQSAKVSCYNQREYDSEVLNLTNDIITYFKSISQLNLFEQQEIYNMFLIHVKSMYFRTKNKIKITNFRDNSITGLYGFYCIAKKVLEKVSIKYDLTYDDDEVKFLSYYFASLEYANEPNSQVMGNAIIVCVSGLGSSMYLKTQCAKLFDNSLNINISDLKNMGNYIDEDTRLIISTINIDEKYRNNIPLKRVHPILTEKEKQELSEWFFLNRFSFNKESEVIRDVMDIIKECAVIKNQQKLFHELNQYFNPMKDQKSLELVDLLKKDSIQILDHVDTLENFINISGKPLVDKGIINQLYINDVIHVLHEHGPYCECFEGILVAHAVPCDNVQYPCLSLCVVKNSLEVTGWNNKKINAIFVLGVTDTESHGNAFSQLIKQLTKHNLYQQINKINDINELYKLLIKG